MIIRGEFMNKVTIRDVAEVAKVAPSTVSRVISDDGRISEKTKKRIRQIMKDMNYYPNAMARNLAINKTDTIAVMMPSKEEQLLTNPFFLDCFRGIATKASLHNYDVLIASPHQNESEVEALQRLVQGGRIDGILILRNEKNDPAIDYLLANKHPFVVIGTNDDPTKDVPTVDNNNIQAAYDLTMLLMDKGVHQIAFIAGASDTIVTEKRLLGFKKAMEDRHIHYPSTYVVTSEFKKKNAYDITSRLLQLETPPRAIMVMDDLMALGVMNRLEEEGMHVPEDIMVASFNNSVLSSNYTPSITSIDINSSKLGDEACDKLVALIEGKKIDLVHQVPYQIIERQSTKI